MMDRERDEEERNRSEATQPTTPETSKKASAKNVNKRRLPMAAAAAAASQNEHSSTVSTATASSGSEATQPTTPQESKEAAAENVNKRRLPMAAAAAAAPRNESSSTASATATTTSPLPPLPHSFATMKVMNFPRKLYEIVKYTTEIGNNQSQRQKYLDYSKILSWHPDPLYDSTFVVWDKDAFMAHVAPRFFPTQNAFRSLERLLNMWCFMRVPEEEQRLAGLPQNAGLQWKNIRVFCHGNFSRSNASRIKNIERRNLPAKRNATTTPEVASVPRGFQNSIHNNNFPLSPQGSLIPILPKPTAPQSLPSGQASAAFATVAASTMALGVGSIMQQSFLQHPPQPQTSNTNRWQQQMQPPPPRQPPTAAMAAHQVPPSTSATATPRLQQVSGQPPPKRPRLGDLSAGRVGNGSSGNEVTNTMPTMDVYAAVDGNPTIAASEQTFQDDGNDSSAWSTPGRASRSTNNPVATRGNDRETVLGSLLQPNYPPPPPHPQRRQTSGQFDDADEEDDDDRSDVEDEMEDDDDTLIF